VGGIAGKEIAFATINDSARVDHETIALGQEADQQNLTQWIAQRVG
jgi:hypothetical protein